MEASVTTLLRNFPKVRRVALSGEPVLVRTREGDLWITAAEPARQPLIGTLKGFVAESDDDLDKPTLPATKWRASL